MSPYLNLRILMDIRLDYILKQSSVLVLYCEKESFQVILSLWKGMKIFEKFPLLVIIFAVFSIIFIAMKTFL